MISKSIFDSVGRNGKRGLRGVCCDDKDYLEGLGVLA